MSSSVKQSSNDAAELLRLPDDEELPPPSLPRAHRITPMRSGSVAPPPQQDYVLAIASALLGAAYTDGALGERELRAIRRILARLIRSAQLPDWLELHLASFDPNALRIELIAERLRALEPAERRHVVELVRQVCDADNDFGFEDERYLTGLILALSLTDEDVSDLVVQAASGIDGPQKRCFDVVFSLGVIAVIWPLLLAIALAIKLSSPGPVLFHQRRYGRYGREISVMKFRTMRVREDGPEIRQATRDDDRVTPIGRLLRRTSLDELPQFFNVLRGEMSVVGPRPHAVAHNQHYKTQILEYMLRHKVKPGITGWAQVNGWRGETDTLEKMIQRVKHDLEYIRRYSFSFDLKIILLTLFGKANKNAY